MIENHASLIMFNREGEEEQFDESAEMLFEQGVELQLLYGFETLPTGDNEFDTTLEEVLHLITHAGYAYAYPDIWGEEPGTAVSLAMDEARGGFFDGVPRQYPDDAWYSYDDRTCEYDCQISEYIYWALTSLLGGQDFVGRLEEIGHEWRLNTPEKLQATDSRIYALLTNPEYAFPTILPDGAYEVSQQPED
ncbi:MAG: hypothetical protein Q9P01_18075 [Anaerolineae bacterium]|nr:hypothetical protein [Anaerolineae bacterium]